MVIQSIIPIRPPVSMGSSLRMTLITSSLVYIAGLTCVFESEAYFQHNFPSIDHEEG